MSVLQKAETTRTRETDGRGRLQLGAQYGGDQVTYVVVDPDTLERVAGPETADVYADGRLHLGSAFASEEVTVAVLARESDARDA